MDDLALCGKFGFDNISWILSEGKLTIRYSARHEKVIPLSQIKNLTFNYPSMMLKGSILIDIGAAPSSFIRLTGNVAVSDAGHELISYRREDVSTAEAIRDYINDYIANPPTASNQSSPSLTDELAKLKSLLDAGVLTQEEFDTAKKKLLT